MVLKLRRGLHLGAMPSQSQKKVTRHDETISAPVQSCCAMHRRIAIFMASNRHYMEIYKASSCFSQSAHPSPAAHIVPKIQQASCRRHTRTFLW